MVVSGACDGDELAGGETDVGEADGAVGLHERSATASVSRAVNKYLDVELVAQDVGRTDGCVEGESPVLDHGVSDM